MAMVNKTRVSHFKVKNTPLKHTEGKENFKRMLSFLQVDKGRLFFIKLSFAEFKISCVAAARKVSPNWSLETMTCHSSHCFSIVWG